LGFVATTATVCRYRWNRLPMQVVKQKVGLSNNLALVSVRGGKVEQKVWNNNLAAETRN